jgi:hypothetical protein
MFGFFKSFIVITRGNYFKTIVKCVIKVTIVSQSMYNVHTCNHATCCSHLHHPFWDTFTIMIPIDIISMATSVPLLKDYCSTML